MKYAFAKRVWTGEWPRYAQQAGMAGVNVNAK